MFKRELGFDSLSSTLKQKSASLRLFALSLNPDLLETGEGLFQMDLDDEATLVLSERQKKLKLDVWLDKKAHPMALEEDKLLPYLDHFLFETFHQFIEKGKARVEAWESFDRVGEQRGLEWVKTTLVVMNSALSNCLKDPDKYFQGKVFLGEKENTFLFRLLLFNLDMLIEFKNDGVHFQAWDQGNKKIQAIFRQMAAPFLDEIIKLFVEMTKVMQPTQLFRSSHV